jgi:ADP-ribose pyrophosphatase YjhB (NUDIX family)
MSCPYGKIMKNRNVKYLTNCFLIKKRNGGITDICLAMKKRGTGEGKWNGSGGKVGDKVDGESIEEAMIREVKEELNVEVKEFTKVAELTFMWKKIFGSNFICCVYLCEKWAGEPVEGEEMAPRWFKISDIPYSKMWVTDEYWLEPVLKGKKVKAWFSFRDEKTIKEYDVSICRSI